MQAEINGLMMAKKNSAVLWTVDQHTNDSEVKAGRKTAQKNIGITKDTAHNPPTGKLIDYAVEHKFIKKVTLDSDNDLTAEFGQPTLSDITPVESENKNWSVGTNSSDGTIETQDLTLDTNTDVTTDGNGTTYVSSVAQASNGKVTYKTKTITAAAKASGQDPAVSGIVPLTDDLTDASGAISSSVLNGVLENYAVTPLGVVDALSSLDVNDSAVDHKYVSSVSESDGKISVSRALLELDSINPEELHKGKTVGINATTGTIEPQDLGTVYVNEGNTPTNRFVSSIAQASNGQISYTTQELKPADSNSIGGIKLGYTDSTVGTQNYAVNVDNNGKAYVNVPWTGTVTSITAGTGLTTDPAAGITGTGSISLNTAGENVLGGIKLGYTESKADRQYPVKLGSSGNNKDKAYVEVPLASVYNTSTPANTYAGLVKSTAAPSNRFDGHYYNVEINNDATMKVYVPWLHTIVTTTTSFIVVESQTHANHGTDTYYVDIGLHSTLTTTQGAGDDNPILRTNNLKLVSGGSSGPVETNIDKLSIWQGTHKVSTTESNGTTDTQGFLAPYVQSVASTKVLGITSSSTDPDWIDPPGQITASRQGAEYNGPIRWFRDSYGDQEIYVVDGASHSQYWDGYLVPKMTGNDHGKILTYTSHGLDWILPTYANLKYKRLRESSTDTNEYDVISMSLIEGIRNVSDYSHKITYSYGSSTETAYLPVWGLQSHSDVKFDYTTYNINSETYNVSTSRAFSGIADIDYSSSNTSYVFHEGDVIWCPINTAGTVHRLVYFTADVTLSSTNLVAYYADSNKKMVDANIFGSGYSNPTQHDYTRMNATSIAERFIDHWTDRKLLYADSPYPIKSVSLTSNDSGTACALTIESRYRPGTSVSKTAKYYLLNSNQASSATQNSTSIVCFKRGDDDNYMTISPISYDTVGAVHNNPAIGSYGTDWGGEVYTTLNSSVSGSWTHYPMKYTDTTQNSITLKANTNYLVIPNISGLARYELKVDAKPSSSWTQWGFDIYLTDEATDNLKTTDIKVAEARFQFSSMGSYPVGSQVFAAIKSITSKQCVSTDITYNRIRLRWVNSPIGVGNTSAYHSKLYADWSDNEMLVIQVP